MVFKSALAALAATASLSHALAPIGADKAALRLVKTSESDAGTWVTPEQKIQMKLNHIGFIDITEIDSSSQFLKALSTKPSDRVTIQRAIEYPSELSHLDEANTLIEASSTEGPKEWLTHLSEYHNRHYRSATGTESANWLFEHAQSLAKSNSAITAEQFKHSFNQSSVIVRLPGKTDDLVIVGAHLDSTSGSATSRSPGADDDGSGTVTVLEALRVLASSGFEPENTLEFHLYAGEEGGLLGSADVYKKYAADDKSIKAFLQQDMTGYSPSKTPCLIEDYTDAGLNDYLSLIIETFTGTAPNRGKCGYGCSDHASADANGFPAAFVFEDLMDKTSPYIHTPNDTIDTIQWDAVERHIKLSIGFLVEASYL